MSSIGNKIEALMLNDSFGENLSCMLLVARSLLSGTHSAVLRDCASFLGGTIQEVSANAGGL